MYQICKPHMCTYSFNNTSNLNNALLECVWGHWGLTPSGLGGFAHLLFAAVRPIHGATDHCPPKYEIAGFGGSAFGRFRNHLGAKIECWGQKWSPGGRKGGAKGWGEGHFSNWVP